MSQALSVVKVGVDATGAIVPLNRTTAAANKLSLAAKGTTASMAGASTAAKGMGASMMAAMGPFIAISAAVTTVGKGLAVFSQRESDVAALSKGLTRLDGGTRSLNKLNKAADRLGNQTLFSEDDFRQGFVLLTSFKKIGVDAYDRVAKSAADIAHANKVDVKTSFMQLAKALQDPERNLAALNRSGIAFTKTETELIKTLMKSGKTSEAHAEILRIVEDSYKDLAIAAGEGFKGKVDKLGESWNDFAQVLGEAVIPILVPLLESVTHLLDLARRLPTPIYTAAAALGGARGLAWAFGLVKTQAAGATISVKGLTLAVKGLFKATIVLGVIQVLADKFSEMAKNADKVKEVLTFFDKGGATAEFDVKTTSREDVINAQAEASRRLKEIDAQFLKLQEKSEGFVKSWQVAIPGWGALQSAVIGGQFEAINAEAAKLKDIIALDPNDFTLAKDLKNAANTDLNPINEQATALQQVFDGIAVTISDGLTDALMGAIEGTKTLGEVASSVFSNISRALIQYGINAGLSNMFPWMAPALGFGKAATGGPVGKDKPYLVGERGPEMFVPNSSGRIIPNNQMGGGSTSVVVNVDASGSAVQGDGGQAEELGSMLAAAVQAELVNQQRPGGLLAGTR